MLLNDPLGKILFPRPPSYSLIGTPVNTANVATYTFSSASIGSEHPNRTIGVIATVNQIAGGTFTSCTLGGQSMDLVIERVPDFGANEPGVGMWTLPFPRGTTATIVVTIPDAGGHCGLAIYSMLGLTTHRAHSAVSGENSSTSSRVALPLSSRKGAIILAAADVYTQNVTFTWDGDVTEDAEQPYGAEAGAAAYASGYGKGSGAMVGITPSGTAAIAYIAASFF